MNKLEIAIKNETEQLLEDIKYFLEYDPVSGKVYHKNPKHSWLKGKEAGYICTQHGYLTLSIHRKRYKGHRIIWALYYGEFADGQIDHIDGNRSNNKITNLRCVDQCTNMGNQIRPHKRNKLGIKNISIQPSPKYRSMCYRLCLSDKKIPIIDRSFKKLKDAIKARNYELKKLGRPVDNIDNNEWLVYFKYLNSSKY
tara:strand:- start:21 stop:611 length:591 start_codon:yes stop_codon:yes gene_type:complete